MYFVVFLQSLRVFYWRHKEGRNMWWLSAVSVVNFVLITIVSVQCFVRVFLRRAKTTRQYLAVDFIRVVSAFTENTSTPNAALRYYDSIDLRQRFVRVFSYSLLTLITDAIIVRNFSD